MDSPPRILYKYLHPDRIDILIDGLARYTPLGAFNDPFEGRPSIGELAPPDKTIALLRESLPEEAKKAYDKLDPEVRRLFPYDAYMRIIQQLATMKEPEMVRAITALVPTVVNMLHQKVDETIGVLSLSEARDSLLMWSHYAESHTGFLLGFDTAHAYFNARLGPSDELRHLRRVQYRDARPGGAMTDLEGVELFLVKSIHWSYEREWRVLRVPQDADLVKPRTGTHPIHLFRLPLDSIREIVIGARTSRETRDALIKAARSTPTLQEARILEAIPDPTHFMLRFNDLKNGIAGHLGT